MAKDIIKSKEKNGEKSATYSYHTMNVNSTEGTTLITKA